MQKEKTPRTESAVFICTKCDKKIDRSQLTEEGNAGENLKTFLKTKMREAGKAQEIRIMTSSCLDVCEDGKQAFTYTPVAPCAKHTETFVVHPEKDREEILAWLLKHD